MSLYLFRRRVALSAALFVARLRLAFSWRPLVGLLCLLSLPALAQVEPLSPAAPSVWAKALDLLALPLILALGSSAVALITQLALYLRSREKESTTFRVLSTVASVVATVAAKVEAVERPLLPEVMTGGKVSAEGGKKLADAALAQVKESLAPAILKSLEQVVGPSGVDPFLGAKLEQANAAQTPPSPP